MHVMKRTMTASAVGHATRFNASSSIDAARRFNGTVRDGTVDLEARTVEVCFTTGQAGKRWHWDIGYYNESLEVSNTAIRKERLDKGLSVIGDHDTWRGIDNVFGITEDYRIENGELIGKVRFAKDEESEKVFQKVVDNILRHFSLGYIVHQYEATLNAGDGMDNYRATDWEPTELSIVVVSFETNNGIRSAEGTKPDDEHLFPLALTINGDESTMNRKFRNLVYRDPAGAHGTPAGGAAPAAAAPAVEPQQRAAEPAAPAPVVAAPVAAAPAPVATADRSLVQGFVLAARSAGFDADHAVAAFARGIDQAAYNAELIAAMATRSAAQAPNVPLVSDQRRDHNQTQISVMADAIMARAGLVDFNQESRKFNGTLMELARHVSGMNGGHLGMSPMEQAKRAFQSTSDFPLILENVMNKTLAKGYEETPRTFLGLGTQTTANDFRAKNTYRMGDAPSLLPLGENGEYESGTIGEAKESYFIDTYARTIGFSRKMLINDDMGALTAVPRMFGQAGSRLESDIVWGLLLNYNFRKNAAADFKMRDGKHLYHADHKNLLTTVASALSKTSLSDMRKLGRKFKTLDGNFMNIMWNTLVVPEELETLAEELLINTILATQTNNTNSFQGKYGFRIEPRLSVVSQTAWYAFTNQLAAFEYAYLAGEEGMYTEVNQSTNIDGMEVLVRKDFGAGFTDERGSARATGA